MLNVRFPWWFSVLLAIFSYSVLKYAIPQQQPSNHFLYSLCQVAPDAAPLSAIGFLLLAAKQLYDGDTPGNPDEHQDDPPRQD